MKISEKRFLELVTSYYKTVITFLRNYTFKGKEVGLDIFIIDFLENNSSCTMSMITEFLGVKSPGTATKRIDRLVDFGFVIRYSSEEDRRLVQLQLTDSGKALYKNFLNNRITAMNILMGEFNEEELDTFLSIIERLLKLNKDMSIEKRLLGTKEEMD
ncbi:MAG: MarR family winged helix-turn-helix transcriptional regulator [Candidatus Hodarchaeota archaeon]